MTLTIDQEPREYSLFRREAQIHVNGGRLQEALAVCDRSVAWADSQGSRLYRDLAFCGRAAVLIALGEGEPAVPRLRRLLMRSARPVPQILAANSLSAFYDQQKDTEKSISYSNRALHHAREGGNRFHLVSSLNRWANTQCREGHFDRATRAYSEALELLDNLGSACSDSIDEWTRGVLLANLGSCLIVVGRTREGLGHLASAQQSLGRQPESMRPDTVMREIHLGLSLGYLHLDRPLIAGRYAEAALDGKGLPVSKEVRKKGLFLLGESSKFAGREDQARGWFGRLQKEFYPDMPDVLDLLLYTDTRDLLDLWG